MMSSEFDIDYDGLSDNNIKLVYRTDGDNYYNQTDEYYYGINIRLAYRIVSLPIFRVILLICQLVHRVVKMILQLIYQVVHRVVKITFQLIYQVKSVV